MRAIHGAGAARGGSMDLHPSGRITARLPQVTTTWRVIHEG
jgi:hypothetical protein